jgi:predicted chitinase
MNNIVYWIREFKLFYDVNQTHFKYINLNDNFQLATILAHVYHESKFKRVDESFLYSTKRFRQIFSNSKYNLAKRYLPCKDKKCEQKIADIIYKPLGGYKYRGRGFIQLTSYSNYKAIEDHLYNIYRIRFEITKNPDILLSNDSFNILITLAYFNMNKLCNIKNFMTSFKIVNSALPKSEKLKRLKTYNKILKIIKESKI